MWERKGLLPFEGTWREQPARIWDMLSVFDSVYIAHENAKAEMDALAAAAKRRGR